jgi:hypothetical protein
MNSGRSATQEKPRELHQSIWMQGHPLTNFSLAAQFGRYLKLESAQQPEQLV